MRRSLIGFVLSIATLLASLNNCALADNRAPLTAKKDTHNYRVLSLPNGLVVLLINDPGAYDAAVCLSVNVGSADDPMSMPGLAHFTEHMLFLGSKRYPDPDAYNLFMNAAGGISNAATNSGRTSYFFQVPGTVLAESLDRLSAAFSDPVFDTDYLDRERNAIDAEYRLKQGDESYRILEVIGLAINPEHSLARFRVGSLETLGSDLNQLKQAVRAFHRQFYHTGAAVLVVRGPQSLEELQKLVDTHFSLIGAGRRTEHVVRHNPNISRRLPARVDYKPLTEKNELLFVFPIKSLPSDLIKKPLTYVLSLLNSKDQGSLQSRLQALKLAENVSTIIFHTSPSESLVGVKIKIPFGQAADVAQIQHALFQYLELIRKKGVQEWRYVELANLIRQNFELMPNTLALANVRSIAANMNRYEVKDWLYGPFRMEKYDSQRILGVLNEMVPHNLLLISISPNADTNNTSKWFSVQYRLQRINSWPIARDIDGLQLPSPNSFIANDLSVVSVKGENKVFDENHGIRIFYRPDSQFQEPIAIWYIKLINPTVNSLPEHVRLSLLIMWLRSVLQPITSQASLAGLSSSFNISSGGITLQIRGVRQKQQLLLEDIVNTLANRNIDAAAFELSISTARQYWNAQDRQMPVDAANNALRVALYPQNWLPGESLANLDSISLDEFRKWRAQWVSKLQVDALAVGNLTRHDVNNFSKILEDYLNPHPYASNMEEPGPRTIGPNLPHVFPVTSPHGNAQLLYMPTPRRDLASQADTMLISQLVGAHFFQELRTRQQLGYIASATYSQDWRQPSIKLLVQSHTYTPEIVQARIESYINSIQSYIDSTDESLLESLKASAIMRLESNFSNTDEMANEYWLSLLRGDDKFQRKQELAKFINSRTKSNISASWAELITAPRLWITADSAQPGNFYKFARSPTRFGLKSITDE